MVTRILAIAILCVGASATAQDSLPSFARTASAVANAIYNGEPVSALDEMMALSDAEYAELSRLKGCSGAMQPGTSSELVVINWHCEEEASDPGLRRSVAMLFDEDGALYGFAINSPIGAFAATETAINDEDLPGTRRFAQRFGEAVEDGDDISLGGLIPVSEFDRVRLAAFRGGSFTVARQRVSSHRPEIDAIERVILRGPVADERERGAAYLYFDEEGRPLGLTMRPRIDRQWQEARRGRSGTAAGGDRTDYSARVVVSGCEIC